MGSIVLMFVQMYEEITAIFYFTIVPFRNSCWRTDQNYVTRFDFSSELSLGERNEFCIRRANAFIDYSFAPCYFLLIVNVEITVFFICFNAFTDIRPFGWFFFKSTERIVILQRRNLKHLGARV